LTKLVKAAVCIAEVWLLAGGAAPAAVAADAGACAEPAGSQPATAAKAAPQKTAASQTAAPQGAARRAATPPPDVSGRKRVGKASFYAKQFAGKPMANGVPMDPQGNNAASRTLPLGTTAKVTNIETGKSAVVTIQDRGPYVDGRLVDLSPATAQQIGLTPRQGIAKVVVAPIAVPLPGGKVKEGAAAHEPLDQPDQAALHEEKKTRLATADSGTRHK
jgi:rare lipoprotein A